MRNERTILAGVVKDAERKKNGRNSKKGTKSGGIFEATVSLMCSEDGNRLIKVPYAIHETYPELTRKVPVLITDYPYYSIKSTDSRPRKGKQEFVMKIPHGRYHQTSGFVPDEDGSLSVRIECKYQRVSGTVDEKMCYPLLNAAAGKFPEKNFILVHAGGGAHPGMVSAVKNLGLGITTMKFHVMSWEEFQDWFKSLGLEDVRD